MKVRGDRIRARPRQHVSARGPGWGCMEIGARRRASIRASDLRSRRPIPFGRHADDRTSLAIRPFEPADLDARRRAARRPPPPAPRWPSRCWIPRTRIPAGARRGDRDAPRRRGRRRLGRRSGTARVVGYLIGIAKDATRRGARTSGSSAAGHAAVDPAVVRELYAVAADAWVADGAEATTTCSSRPPTTRSSTPGSASTSGSSTCTPSARPPAGELRGRAALRARRSGSRRARTSRRSPSWSSSCRATSQASPVFSRLPHPAARGGRGGARGRLRRPDVHLFVAEHEGRVIGDAIGCAARDVVRATRPDPARRTPASSATRRSCPDARGLGAGRALGEAVLAGHATPAIDLVATDWRSTNLEADRTWRAVGFRPTFRRLHRLIGSSG